MIKAEHNERLRGEILHIIRENQRRRKSRLTDSMLFAVLERLHYDVTLNEVQMLLEDLKGRNYLDYGIDRSRRDGERHYFQIEITAQGVDIVEGRASDPAVDLG